MIKPTIGRVVWFWDNDIHQLQPLPGIICFVHDDTNINLAVFDIYGNMQPRTSVLLYNGEGERPEGYFAEWMPYQIRQAKRDEQIHPIAAVAKVGGKVL